jgi:hypothetical protein
MDPSFDFRGEIRRLPPQQLDNLFDMVTLEQDELRAAIDEIIARLLAEANGITIQELKELVRILGRLFTTYHYERKYG